MEIKVDYVTLISECYDKMQALYYFNEGNIKSVDKNAESGKNINIPQPEEMKKLLLYYWRDGANEVRCILDPWLDHAEWGDDYTKMTYTLRVGKPMDPERLAIVKEIIAIKIKSYIMECILCKTVGCSCSVDKSLMYDLVASMQKLE